MGEMTLMVKEVVDGVCANCGKKIHKNNFWVHKEGLNETVYCDRCMEL